MECSTGYPPAFFASMKVPARRRGNQSVVECLPASTSRLNESPRPKAGKFLGAVAVLMIDVSLNESPRPKAGK